MAKEEKVSCRANSQEYSPPDPAWANLFTHTDLLVEGPFLTREVSARLLWCRKHHAEQADFPQSTVLWCPECEAEATGRPRGLKGLIAVIENDSF